MTPKQERFVQEYLVDLNATQAAIRAGYSKRTAEKIGSENIRKPEIAAAIEAARSERSDRTKINADWVLRRLAEEAEADVADLYTDEGALKPVHDWPMIWRKGLVSGLDVEEVREEGEVIGTIRKLKLSERIKRLELIGKHVGVQAFKEQVEHKGSVLVQVVKFTDA
jgi:phage terminase small subunit